MYLEIRIYNGRYPAYFTEKFRVSFKPPKKDLWQQKRQVLMTGMKVVNLVQMITRVKRYPDSPLRVHAIQSMNEVLQYLVRRCNLVNREITNLGCANMQASITVIPEK